MYANYPSLLSGVPVTSTGVIGGKLLGADAELLNIQTRFLEQYFLGLVTSRDIDFIRPEDYPKKLISEVMVPRERLMVGGEKLTLEEAYAILQKEKKGP